MGYRSLNNMVACEPFAKHGIQAKVAASGLVMAENYTTLTKLAVVADGPDGIKAGDFVFVSGRLNNHPWAKEVLEREDGKKFILVPIQHVAMVETLDPQVPSPFFVPRRCSPGDSA
jgi:hypothetical protein